LLIVSAHFNVYAEAPLWLRDLTILASDRMEGRRTNSDGSKKAQVFLQERFTEEGLLPLPAYPDYLQAFAHQDRAKIIHGKNVIGWKPGAVDKYLVVTAHYDHLGRKGRRIFNGADDNASGVAAMLTLAHLSRNRPSQCHLVFVATDAEEFGLFGAYAFLRLQTLPQERIFANLNMDMLSQPGGRHELLVSGETTFNGFAEVIEEVIEITQLPMISTDSLSRVGRSFRRNVRANASDHAAFAEQGIPYLYLGAGRHSYYHTPRDTSERINQGFYKRTVNAAWHYLQKMDLLCGAQQVQ
jgi:Zn-dependent M28 family amino/carboxypeptidase